MTDNASQQNSLNDGGKVPTALDTQTTAPDGAGPSKSVAADGPWLTPAKWDELHRFEKLVERIADWSDDELAAVDARQTRHIARVVCDGANPEYPNFAAGAALGIETPSSATELPGDPASVSDGPEIRDNGDGTVEVNAGGLHIPRAVIAEAPPSGGIKFHMPKAFVPLPHDWKMRLGWLDGCAIDLAEEGADRSATAVISGRTAGWFEGVEDADGGPTQEEQRETFEVMTHQPRPSAVSIKAAIERGDEIIRKVLRWTPMNAEEIRYVPTSGECATMGFDLRAMLGMLDLLAIHCLALEIERDDLAKMLDRCVAQAKPVDGTDLAELCQHAERFAEHLGPTQRMGADVVRKLIGAVNDQARKLATWEGMCVGAEDFTDVEVERDALRGTVTEYETLAAELRAQIAAFNEPFDITKPRDVRQDALLSIDVLERFGAQAGHLTEGDARKCAKSMRALLVDRDRMEPARDAATDVVKDLEFDLTTTRISLDNANRILGETRAEKAAAVADRDKADAAHGCAARDHRAQLKILAATMEAGAIALDQIEAAFVKETRKVARLKRKLRKARARRLPATYTDGDRRNAIKALEDSQANKDNTIPSGGTVTFYRGLTVDTVATALGMQKVGA